MTKNINTLSQFFLLECGLSVERRLTFQDNPLSDPCLFDPILLSEELHLI